MQLALVKTQGGVLVPLTEADKALLDKKRIGTVLEAHFKVTRNPKFHRKYFALLNLGFDYWNPKGGTVSPQERNLLSRFAGELAKWGGEQQTLQDLANGFLDVMAQKRASLEVEKSFEAYRKWVAMEAGFFKIVVFPNGAVKKEAKSISFAKMDDNEFAELYRASFTVIWNHILHKYFESEDDAEKAVNQLLGFA
ncbi:hypothetical protein A1OO_08750 [Enterovibrio norvegicus FF-33]|uniref:DUF1367 family protein n=1 Tax=Enterovibrio norvegicus TaxID=188144 RepID=UPI0002FAE0D0|nr:DUF1367 family protein [Enterovibrio norvegicus]OEE65887.1 hypothetical protein A1OO_08750 [Enterovibrio norvegicus FF-33]